MGKLYDVLILGGGLAGYYSGRTLARGGKTVALVEKETLGGTGLRWGALPVKRVLDSLKRRDMGFISTWDKDLDLLGHRIRMNLIAEGVDLYFGDGEFIDSRSYRIGDRVLEGRYIIIATGTRPTSIEGIPVDGRHIITHMEAIDLNPIPESIIILGGNVEGVEFASLYGQMGIGVTLVEEEDVLLMGNDEDLVFPIEDSLRASGVDIIKGNRAKQGWIDDGRVKISLEDGRVIEADKALVTLLREANIPKGMEKLNIGLRGNRIAVDENLATGQGHVFAIGDINGIMEMGHVAIYQGIQVARHILYDLPIDITYKELPRAIFTLPEMAGVGKQEWELKRPYRVGYSYFKDSWRGWAKGIEDGFVKIIVDKSGLILGIWMVGRDVSEYIGLLGVLIHKKVTIADIKSNQ